MTYVGKTLAADDNVTGEEIYAFSFGLNLNVLSNFSWCDDFVKNSFCYQKGISLEKRLNYSWC